MGTSPLNPLLAGYFGHGNVGDELILTLLRRHLGSPPYLSGPLPRESGNVPQFRWGSLRRAFRASNALVLGGGELFQSRTSVRSLAYYLLLPLLARVMGRPLFGFSLALDPHLSPLFQRATAAVLRRAQGLWVREEGSLQILEKRGVPSRRMPDVGWAWPASGTPLPSVLRRVLWIPRFTSRGREFSAWAAMIHSLTGDRLWEHGFLPLQPSREEALLARFRSGLRVFTRGESAATFEDVLECMSRYDVVVTMRYHGLVAAALARRPVVALAAHGKVRNLAWELGVPCVPAEGFATQPWRKILAQAFEGGPADPGDRPRRANEALAELSQALSQVEKL